MDMLYKNKIYDRLLEIKLNIEIQNLPNPQYINEMIGQCHVFIEEVERYNIEVCKEISIRQQALNNAIVDFDIKKETLLANHEEIKNLPSIKDREARAHLSLKNELDRINQYKNDVSDLNNLLKATMLKIKNLNRANMDIRMQLRVLEAQLKLNETGPEYDRAAKSLLEEMKKSTLGTDSFQDAETEIIEEKTLDPSEPINSDDLFDSEFPEIKEPEIKEPEIKEPEIKEPETKESETKESEIKEPEIKEPEIKEPETKESEKKGTLKDILGFDDSEDFIEPIPNLAENSIVQMDNESIELADIWTDIQSSNVNEIKEPENIVDLNSVIETTNKKGGSESSQNNAQTKMEKVGAIQKETHQVAGIDIDDLLDSIQTI